MQMTLPVAEIGKPPDVAEADGESKTREQELDRIVPAAAVLVHRRVFAEVVVMEILRSVILGQAGLRLHIKKLRYCILALFPAQRSCVRIWYGFQIMDGREDRIYRKSSFLSWHWDSNLVKIEGGSLYWLRAPVLLVRSQTSKLPNQIKCGPIVRTRINRQKKY